MSILPVTESDIKDWCTLALELWSDEGSFEEMREILVKIFQSPRETGFIVRSDDGTAIGFMNLSLRSEYVHGADHYPVGYLEGVYVKKEFQRQGIGKKLICTAEAWARERGCTEIASDALLGNTDSYQFHTKIGFQEVERIVTFVKTI